MDPILEMARKYNLAVIEDATESLGAVYKGRKVGCLGDVACFSFNGNKIITTGGGGMVVTDNIEWAQRAKYLTTQAKDDPVESIHHEIGYNYRLSNLQAAMGCAQMEKIDEYIAIKRRLARAYTDAMEISGIAPMREAPWARSIFWLYTMLVDEREYGIDSRALQRWLAKHSIESRPLWQPLHLSPVHKTYQAFRIEVACELYQKGLSLPSSVGLTEENIERVIEVIKLGLEKRSN